MTSAEELLELALADPARTREVGTRQLQELPEHDSRNRSIVLRALSLASRHAGKLQQSIDYARRSVELAGEADLEALRLMGLLTLSGSMAIAGRITGALEIIEDTLPTIRDRHIEARFTFQRGAVLSVLDRPSEAVEAFEAVLPVFRDLDDKPALDLVLDHLGQNLTSLGRLDEAEAYLEEALVLATEMGELVSIAGIEHNLGLLAAYRGDIPSALERLQRSDKRHMELSGASAPQHVARCEVLISVGLYREAIDLATRIAEMNRVAGDTEHEANALLVAARASLHAGEPGRALELAERAEEALGGVESSLRVLEARRIRVEARFAFSGASRELLEEAVAIAGRQGEEGLVAAAGHSHLLVGRIALALGEVDRAKSALRSVAKIETGPVELRIQGRLARALLRLAEEDTRGSAAAVRSGLDLLDEYQAAIGATDLRIGIERQGAELAELGLELALRSGRPRRILDWMDRTRARALRHSPVIPEHDDEVRVLLAELRRIDSELRKPDSRGDESLLRKRRRLQEQIAHADRVKRARADAGPGSRVSVTDLIDAVGDRCLLEMGNFEGRLIAVEVSRGRARLVDIGDSGEIGAELSQARFALRRAARRGRDVGHLALQSLDRLILGDWRLGDPEEVIVVPPPSLMAAPWTALPRFGGRPVTISPSAEIWWRSSQMPVSRGAVVVAGGPDLEIAGSEVAAVGDLYDGALVFPPASASVEDVKSAIGGASIAHIACHATFRGENPMFSSLRLGDGDLNVYDIERLDTPPAMVVLSACDSGYTEAGAGHELAGLTSALLSMGTRSVVASVGLVPDTAATSQLMVGFHRRLIRGLRPGQALAEARSETIDDPEGFMAAASIVCVGA